MNQAVLCFTKHFSLRRQAWVFYSLALYLLVNGPIMAQSALINASPAQVRAAERFWIFGNGARLDFGTSGNAPATSSKFGSQNKTTAEGFATATDFDGNLLFYTSATQTYDRLGAATPNGAITGSNSATQGVIILPHLGNPDRYLTVYTSTNVGASPNGDLKYSVFDINQNGGKGDLVSKNQNPHPTGTNITANEMITYAPNATGDGFWIVSGINNSTCSLTSYACTSTETRIYAIEVKFPGGNTVQFGTPVISQAASLFNGYGSIEFNEDYSRALVLSGYYSPTTLNKRGILTEVNFNPSTGQFTQRWNFLLPNLPGIQSYYYADYSPGEQFAFVSTVFANGAFRYDITSANAATILSTQAVVLPPAPTAPISGAVRTGPNGKTYFASYNSPGIWELTNPDAPTVAAYTFVAKGFGTGTGAFAFSQTTLGVAVDYGDAPETYATNSSDNGPRHRILYDPSGAIALAIGASSTSEPNGVASTNADSDIDDGISSFPEIAGGTIPQNILSYSVSVAVINKTTKNATLSGWIDWNNNGTFDASEISTLTILPGQTAATLTWTNRTLTGAAGATATYARFRISTEAGLLATGPASNGEVEDYIIPFSTPLPVSLVRFDVERSEQISLLSWSTTRETNSDQFEIERSLNGKSWAKIGTVKAAVESSIKKDYTYKDIDPVNGENLYRLKMVDKDKTFTYSRIQSINFDSEIEPVTYPNPVSDRLLIKNFDKVKQVIITGISGNSVMQLDKVSANGIDVRKLIPGSYVLTITLVDGTLSKHKVVVNR